jgi:hypothetical protein
VQDGVAAVIRRRSKGAFFNDHNIFGDMLVTLAWAFHRRGHDDMSRHLLTEAPSRIPRWSLDKTLPPPRRLGPGTRPRVGNRRHLIPRRGAVGRL